MIRGTFIGFFVGAAVPIGFGLYRIVWELAYREAMPIAPNQGYCGMGMLGAWILILFGGPICGAIGASCGASWLCILRHDLCGQQ